MKKNIPELFSTEYGNLYKQFYTQSKRYPRKTPMHMFFIKTAWGYRKSSRAWSKIK